MKWFMSSEAINGGKSRHGPLFSMVADVRSPDSFSIGGTVSGLRAPGLVLDLNGESMLLFEQDGPYTFPLGVIDGGSYTVSTPLVPADHDCQLANEFGTIGGADVTNADVTCTTDILFSDGLETLSATPIPLK